MSLKRGKITVYKPTGRSALYRIRLFKGGYLLYLCFAVAISDRTEIIMTIGERICEYRKRRGLTQAALAEMLGITDKAVSKWERGISSPDVSLLSELASALDVTADELITGGDCPLGDTGEKFISLEKYLMGEFGYVVPDLHPEGEEIAFVIDHPDMDEADRGYAFSGAQGLAVNQFLFSKSEPFSLAQMKEGKLGVTYVANVPLGNLNPPVTKIMGELEYTRLNKFHINRLLLDGVMKKLERLVLSDTVRLIVLTREFNKKYFGAFVSYADAKLLSLMQEKIAKEKLRILYVTTPRFWDKGVSYAADDLLTLKEYAKKLR